MNDGANHSHDHVEEESPLSHLGLESRHASLSKDIAEILSHEERDAFFFSLVDAAADALIVHRPDGTVVYANAEAAKLLGYDDPASLLDLPPYGWVAASQMQTAPRRIDTILNEGLATFESGARRCDGTVLPTEVRTRRVDTPLGPMMVSVIRDISQRMQNRAALEHLAYHDALTGLSNRIHFEDRLALAIADARRYGDELALAYVDLDHFKPVNDRYGHAVGDDVLVEVARRLRECVREQDTVARLGGDEFVILFPRLAAHWEVESISQRLVERVAEPMSIQGYSITVEASVGLGVFDAASDDPRTLLVKADIAMYTAKQDPEHAWLLYEPSMRLPDHEEAQHLAYITPFIREHTEE